MNYEARKRFRVAGVDYGPGDPVDPTGWPNADLLERNNFIRPVREGAPREKGRGKGRQNGDSNHTR